MLAEMNQSQTDVTPSHTVEVLEGQSGRVAARSAAAREHQILQPVLEVTVSSPAWALRTQQSLCKEQ